MNPLGRTKLKQSIIIITYAVALVIFVMHFDDVLNFLGKFLGLMSPFFIGVAIAFVLDRPYKGLKDLFHKKCKIKENIAKIMAILFVYLAAFGIIGLLIRFIAPQIGANIQTFISNIGNYLEELQSLLNKITDLLGMRRIDISEFSNMITDRIDEIGAVVTDMLPKILSVTTNFISGLASFVIAIVLSIYVMSGQRRLISQVKRIAKAYMPARLYDTSCYVSEIIVEVFRNYVSGQMLEACILGSLCTIGMFILRLDYAALIGVVIGITALVPILGAWVGGGVAFVLLLLVSPRKAIIFLIFLVILQQVENNLIYPKVVGTKLGLPAIWVLLGVSVGGGLFGIVGMFIGVPVATVIYTLLKNDVNRRVSDEDFNDEDFYDDKRIEDGGGYSSNIDESDTKDESDNKDNLEESENLPENDDFEENNN